MMIDTLPHPLLRPTPLRLSKISLFLDIDGTLAGFEATPEAVQPLARRTLLLQRLGRALEGRIAAVSGRDLTSIDRILERSVGAAAGVHGLERRRPDGSVLRAAPHPALTDARQQAEAFATATPGVLVEDKGLAFALHYRQAPQARAAVEALAALLAESGLALQPGEDVMELKTPGTDKGVSVRAFMAEPPFDMGLPVFVGDDLTDEHAFAAAKALGGFGVLVGQPRPTLARYRLDGVEDVLDWLERSLET